MQVNNSYKTEWCLFYFYILHFVINVGGCRIYLSTKVDKNIDDYAGFWGSRRVHDEKSHASPILNQY